LEQPNHQDQNRKEKENIEETERYDGYKWSISIGKQLYDVLTAVTVKSIITPIATNYRLEIGSSLI